MKKNDASRKALRIIGSILVAIALWIYVDTVTSPEVTLKVKNVPVEFSGEDTTLADRGLMLLSGYDTTVDLVIKGPRNELRKLDRSKIRIVANTSNIKEAGSQTLTYEVVFPDNIRRGKLTVDSASIYSITVTVGELDNGYKIRRAAIDLNIPLITNARLASAFINAFCTMTPDDLAIKSWEEYK